MHTFHLLPDLPSFPTRRSSDLCVERHAGRTRFDDEPDMDDDDAAGSGDLGQPADIVDDALLAGVGRRARICEEDRKSTRLNSSHVSISYAVFCLKKKK